jgi:DNA-binding MarR family transcriptional regulator
MRHKAARRHNTRSKARTLSEADYRRIAEFRFLLRQFLAFSEDAARRAGLAPQQHQALLAVKGFGGALSIRELAEKLAIRHHSAVGLVDRLVEASLLRRVPDETDRRKVTLVLTPEAEKLLDALTSAHRDELRRLAPLLKPLLAQLGD